MICAGSSIALAFAEAEPSTIVSPPASPWPSQPVLPTNAPGSAFLDNHAEKPQPDQAPLSLQSGAPPTSEATEIIRPPAPAGGPAELVDHLLVVYNQNDPNSKVLADYYAKRRGIPDERVYGISCPTKEEISRDEFEDTIRRPILSYLGEKNWITQQSQQGLVCGRPMQLLLATRNDIWAIVLMRGVPLKIAPDPSITTGMETIPEFQTNAAAVDSELALLPIFGLPKGGFVPNSTFDLQMTGRSKMGPDQAKSMIMVTRLDGPQPSDVLRMIDDTIEAETHRLAGLAVVDTRGLVDPKNPYSIGDEWFRTARTLLAEDGWTVKFDDKPEVLPATDPCNQVALYFGWYTSNAEGPWITPPNRFVPGAIAYHLHSFSANTVRDATSAWVGPMIAHGAAATMGTVYEPALGLTPRIDIFTKQLLNGNCFAEAAYASEPGLSWMVTVIGDPLYRPFRQPLQAALAEAQTPHSYHDDWLLLQDVRRALTAGALEPNGLALSQKLKVPGSGPVAYEGLGDLLVGLNAPLTRTKIDQAYQEAMVRYQKTIDRIRVGLKLAQYDEFCGDTAGAKDQIARLQRLYPTEAQRFGFAPPPPATPPQPPKAPGR